MPKCTNDHRSQLEKKIPTLLSISIIFNVYQLFQADKTILENYVSYSEQSSLQIGGKS